MTDQQDLQDAAELLEEGPFGERPVDEEPVDEEPVDEGPVDEESDLSPEEAALHVIDDAGLG